MKRTDKFRWGILGCAGIAIRKFIPALREARRTEVLAIASRTREKAQAAAADLDIPRGYGSYDELLADPDVDAIYNPLPNDLHCPWTIRAAAAGKHVLCEKPLAMNAAEVRRMIAACKRHRVVLMEAFMYRFHPQWDLVRSLIAAGRIGDVRLVRATFSFVINRPADNYRYKLENGGGARMDVGCYCVNAARLVFGCEPERVAASHHISKKLGVDMTTCGVLEFPGKRIAVFDSSFEFHGRFGIDIEGTGGRIFVPVPWLPAPDRAEIVLTSGGNTKTLRARHANQYTLEAEHFADCVRTGSTPRFPASDALANMRVLDAIARSARNGTSVRL